MNWLLDTNIVLALVGPASPRQAVAVHRLAGAERIMVSAVSLWEIAIKSGSGKLDVKVGRVADALRKGGFHELAVSWRHASAVRDLPLIHTDPFDRLLVAQAMVEPLSLLTSDRTLGRYSELVHVI